MALTPVTEADLLRSAVGVHEVEPVATCGVTDVRC